MYLKCIESVKNVKVMHENIWEKEMQCFLLISEGDINRQKGIVV